MGAAVAVSVALAEADAVSPALDQITLLQLKRICSGILSTLGLAVARASLLDPALVRRNPAPVRLNDEKDAVDHG